MAGFYALAATLHVGEVRGVAMGGTAHCPGPARVHVTTCAFYSTHRAAKKGTTATPGSAAPAYLHPVSLPAQRVSGRCSLALFSVKTLFNFYYHWGMGDLDPILP